MADHQLPEAAWPLQYRHTERTVFTTSPRDSNPFERKDMYERTLRELRYELEQLKVSEAWLQLVLGGGEADLRRDGQLRARADVRSPGVALTVVTAEHGTLVYTCDQHEGRWTGDPPDWQINLRAITVGLKDLRRLDRYGIAGRGQQYAGFRELGTGTAVSDDHTQSRADVLRYLRTMAGWDTEGPEVNAVLTQTDMVHRAHRAASKRNHPDTGGNTTQQAYINTARDHLLETMAG